MFSMAFGILANAQCQIYSITGVNQITCCGLTNGSIDVWVSGGTAPYNISWTGPVSGNPVGNEINNTPGLYTIYNLPGGTYSISVIDANGCVTQTSAIITEPACLIANLIATNCLCFGDQSGSIQVTANGGVAGYNVSWTGPVSGNPVGQEILMSGGAYSITGLPAGSYTVTVSDTFNCTTSSNITITQPNALSAFASNLIEDDCYGTSIGAATITASNGTAPYNVSWTGPSSGNPAGVEIAASGGSYTINSLPAGVYTATVTDANSCTANTTITITQPSALAVTAVVSTAIPCSGGQGVVTVSAVGGTLAYSGTGNFTVSAGTHTFPVTDGNGCIDSVTITVTQPSPLNVTGITSNNGIDITVGGGTPPWTYAWSTGTTTEDLTNLMPGTYTVTVTDTNGCTQTDSFTVQNADILTVSSSVLEIYPNPACDKLTLKMKHSDNVPFYIADNLGRTVIKGRSEFELTEIPIDSLKAGIYLLHIDNVTLTFIKE
jgi:uncharacterized protein (DUF2141 family)